MANPASETFDDKKVRKHAKKDRRGGSAARAFGETPEARRGRRPVRPMLVSAERKGAAYARFPRDGVATGLPEPKKVLEAITKRKGRKALKR